MSTIFNVPSRVVHRYADEHSLQEIEAVHHFDELTKFLEICASTPERCAPSGTLDKVWHGFIQFTLEYREFCLSNFGRMIDHDPSPREENIQPYLRTREIAEKRFGELNPLFWPFGVVGATMCGAPGATMCGATVSGVAAN